MSIDYSYVKNGFFMTEKFNFENLSAFNSAEGRIFYPLAVESGDFPQLRSVFSQAMRCGKPVTARILGFSPRSQFFAWEWIETSSKAWLMNYRIHLINHFWKMMRKRRVLITFGIFSMAEFQGFFATHHQLEFSFGRTGGRSLGRLISTSSIVNRF